MLKNTSLAVKLNILVFLVLTVMLVGVAILLILNTRNLTEEIGGERVVEEVNIIQNRLAEIEKELLVDTNFVVTSVAFFQAVGRRSAADTTDIITTANASLGLDDITVVDGDGRRLTDTSIDEDPTREDALLQEALNGKTVTVLLVEKNAGVVEVSIAVAAPVVSSTGNRLGAIQMSRHINRKFLQSLIFGRQNIQLGLVYDGNVIVRSGDDQAITNILANGIPVEQNSIEAAKNGQTVVREGLILGEQGVPHTVAYTPVLSEAGKSPAVIMIMVELEEIYSFQNSTLLNTIVIFIALTVFALAILYVNIYRTVISPLNKLRIIAGVMTSGRYHERAQASTIDEVGQLATAFNTMAIAIQQREVSLQAAREHAERANQVKSMFLASVSHELRTPLNAIINLTKFVGLGMYGPVNAEQTDILSKVEARSKHLLNLINDVLDISKIESGSLELFVENDVKVSEIVALAVETAQSLLPGKPIVILCEIEPNLPSLTADAQRIQQIILNLLSNACKFTDQGQIRVCAGVQDGEIIITIADSGSGIAPENHELIFEAFRQTKEGLRKGEGTGLGLPISRRLAEAHQGRMWVESSLGNGATFYVALPLKTSLVPTI
ncbi:MAG: ATP-binding protein [Chloroflexota bacterium]